MKEGSYLRVQGWMREYLSRTSADIFSIVYNATHGKRGYFDGSLNYIVEQTGASRRTALRHLQELEDNGLIMRIGRNAYKNVKYVSCVDKESISESIQECQKFHEKGTGKSAILTPLDDEKATSQKCHFDTFKSAILTPHKNLGLNKTLKPYIYMSGKPDANNERSSEEMKKLYDGFAEENYNRSKAGWWNDFVFFPDDEELDDLFLKFLDKTSEKENQYKDGCKLVFDIFALTTAHKWTDEEIDRMTDKEAAAVDLAEQADTEPIKLALRAFIYRSESQKLSDMLGIAL